MGIYASGSFHHITTQSKDVAYIWVGTFELFEYIY